MKLHGVGGHQKDEYECESVGGDGHGATSPQPAGAPPPFIRVGMEDEGEGG